MHLKTIALSALLFGMPFVASAWGFQSHHTYQRHYYNQPQSPAPAPAPTPTLPTASGSSSPTSTGTVSTQPPTTVTSPTSIGSNSTCFNYGHQNVVNGAYDQKQVAGDLAVLKASGVTCLRLAYYGYGNAGVSYDGGFLPEKLAAMIQQWDGQNNWRFSIILGGDFGTMSSGNFASYDQTVMQTAQWAQAHGIEQLSLGNEQESRLSGLSQSDWDAHVRTLATKVKTVYGGKVSYEIDPAYLSGWISGGLGSLDMIGLNTYCCYSSYPGHAISAFGKAHVFLSEFNDDRGYFTNAISQWASSLTTELATVKALGIPVYYFTYRDGGDGVQANTWAVQFTSGQNTPVAKVLGIVASQ